MKDSFLETMELKYVKVFQKILLFNEWAYLVGNENFLEWDEVAMLRKYINSVVLCKKNNCINYCLELKPLTFS